MNETLNVLLIGLYEATVALWLVSGVIEPASSIPAVSLLKILLKIKFSQPYNIGKAVNLTVLAEFHNEIIVESAL